MQNMLLRNVGYFFIWADFYALVLGVHALFVGAVDFGFYVQEYFQAARVFLDWFWDGHLRVKKIKHIRPFKTTGVFNGILIKKGDKWIDVENEENLTPWRFYARWKGGLPEDGGEYNPKTLEFFDNFEIDDPVRFVWSYDYRPRIDRFIEQEEDDVFVPFYEGKSIPDSPSTPQPAPPVVNPFDQSPKTNPFDQPSVELIKTETSKLLI